MRIAIIVRDLDIKGGTQKQVLRLAQFLKNKGRTVEIITYDYTVHIPLKCPKYSLEAL
jgi:hypothetical protein